MYVLEKVYTGKADVLNQTLIANFEKFAQEKDKLMSFKLNYATILVVLDGE